MLNFKIFDMRTFKPPVEVHGVAVLAVHGHGAELSNAFSDTTIKRKVVQNVATYTLADRQGVQRPAELPHDAGQAVHGSSAQYFLPISGTNSLDQYYYLRSSACRHVMCDYLNMLCR